MAAGAPPAGGAACCAAGAPGAAFGAALGAALGAAFGAAGAGAGAWARASGTSIVAVNAVAANKAKTRTCSRNDPAKIRKFIAENPF